MKRNLTLILLLLSIGCFGCTCADLMDISILKRINMTEQIFEGTVIDIKPASEFDLTAEFQITRKIKGVDHLEKINIQTSKMSSMCGVDFVKGQKWLIFSTSNYTSICNVNMILDKDSKNNLQNSDLRIKERFYYSKLHKFLNKISNLTSTVELSEYDINDNLIAKGKIGKDKEPIGNWFYADITTLNVRQKN